jgi:threonine dehydrogenase-like Zn-dependent dehydrogenase
MTSTDTPEACQRLLIRAPFQFRRESVPLGPARADYVVRVDVCGLCRSDLHGAASWATDWCELGHEFGGTIVAVRRRRARFAAGDRVAVRNAASCGQCHRCLDGAPRACEQLVVNMQGFRDYALCDERSLVAAGGLDDDALALVEPTNVVLDLLHTADLERAHRVTVIGAGTLGLLAAYFVREVAEVADLVLVGRHADSPLAAALGLCYVSTDGPVRPADRVLVTAPPSALAHAMTLCRPGGGVLTVGLDDAERCRTEIDAMRLIFGQQTLRGVCAAPNAHFEEAVDLLRRHGATLRMLIARRTSRCDLESVLREWHARPRYEGKTIVLGSLSVQ